MMLKRVRVCVMPGMNIASKYIFVFLLRGVMKIFFYIVLFQVYVGTFGLGRVSV